MQGLAIGGRVVLHEVVVVVIVVAISVVLIEVGLKQMTHLLFPSPVIMPEAVSHITVYTKIRFGNNQIKETQLNNCEPNYLYIICKYQTQFYQKNVTFRATN